MGGDHGPQVTVAAALSALQRHPDLELLLVGRPEAVEPLVSGWPAPLRERAPLIPAREVVEMDESPSKALRNKKDSSMRVAIDLVKSGRARAAVSAGNTGALMATARFVLKTLPGIDRPAIISPLPALRGRVHMLDLGANAECTAEQLEQFALMGSALVRAVHGVARPRVALLNIGEEEIKGNEVIKQAAQRLQASGLHYVGFVEGDGIFLSDVDVVVCDGFVGNVALKTGEGVAKLIRDFLKQEFGRNPLTRLAALAALPVLKRLGARIDPRHHNGASLVGLNGIVIKSHGGADALAFGQAIEVARREVHEDVPGRIREFLAGQVQAAPAA